MVSSAGMNQVHETYSFKQLLLVLVVSSINTTFKFVCYVDLWWILSGEGPIESCHESEWLRIHRKSERTEKERRVYVFLLWIKSLFESLVSVDLSLTFIQLFQLREERRKEGCLKSVKYKNREKEIVRTRHGEGEGKEKED